MNCSGQLITSSPGTVASYNNDTGKYDVNYDDGEKETLRLQDEKWRFVDTAPPQPSSVLPANDVELSPGKELPRLGRQLIDEYHNRFGNKEFMLHEAQALPSCVTHNAYKKEESSFLKTVQLVHISDVPENENVITSHVLYKVKDCDDRKRLMKARIAPHGNKDSEKDGLKTDSTSCPPTGIRALLSNATIHKWPLAKIDFKSAFLQTGDAKRDVYVVPPRECESRSRHYWLLLTAAYGLVNANAKWQEHSDQFLHSIGFKQISYILQLFYIREDSDLVSVAVKVVDDILFSGELRHLKMIVATVQSTYELGTVVYGPGTFQFFGLIVIQSEDFNIQIHADHRIASCEAYPISRQLRKQIEETLSQLEKSSYFSLNSSLGWIGVAASPFVPMQQVTCNRKGLIHLWKISSHRSICCVT